MRAEHRRWIWPAAVFVAGVVVASLAAAAAHIPAGDTIRVLLESVAGAAIAGLAAVGSLVVLRRTRFAVQATVAALAPIAALAIGVTWATSDMFITSHDLRVLWVVLLAAGGAGVATSLVLAQRVAAASRSVGAMARILGEEGPGALSAALPAPAAPGELAKLATDLQRTSQRLSEAQARAAAEEQTRRQLVAWVSHDLRTPLAGIRAMIEALEDGVVSDGPTVGRYHTTIRLETDRLAGLVDDLFELSQIQSGSLALELAPVPLDEVLADAVEGAGVAARMKGVELHYRAADPCPIVDVATPEMIRVVRNLLDNAIRHTDAPGSVTLTAGVGADGSEVEVSVVDGCGGIPAEDIDRVFEMGYRGDSARTPGQGRGGLGLAVAHGLVRAHDGRISVTNESAGCRFTVRLPIHQLLDQEPRPAG